MHDVDRQIAEKQREIDKLQAIKKALETMTPVQRLAIALYDLNHFHYQDSWPYEFNNGGHEWTGWAHKEMLEKATNALRIAGGNETLVIEMAKALR